MANTRVKRVDLRQKVLTMDAHSVQHAVIAALSHTTGNRAEDLSQSMTGTPVAELYSFLRERFLAA